MPVPPRLTIALPTCNGGRHLREALAGIKAQSDVGFDLIVSDDRSDDDTLAIVREEVGDRARISTNSERLGLAGNWNRCVERSGTEWVAIFHQDDVMHSGHLASHLSVIDAHPNAKLGIVAGPVVMIDEAGQPISPRVVDPGGLVIRFRLPPGLRDRGFPYPSGIWTGYLAATNPLRCSAVTIRKEAHQSVGGFDPSYCYVVDWDFWLRISQDWGLGWTLGPPTVSMRWHPSSETHRFKTGTADLEERVRLLESIERIPGIDTSRGAGRSILGRAYLNRSHAALKAGDANLASHCLGRALAISPGTWSTIAFDPRLALQMAVLKANPTLAVRWFAKRNSSK